MAIQDSEPNTGRMSSQTCLFENAGLINLPGNSDLEEEGRMFYGTLPQEDGLKFSYYQE